MLIRTLLIVAALILAMPAIAAVNIDGLTPEQNAELNLQAVKQIEANKANQVKAATPQQTAKQTVETISTYAELGKSIGVGLVSTAKELGVAVNEFANTDVGRLSTFLIVWKMVGIQLFHYVAGFVWFVVMFTGWIWLFRRMCLIQSSEPVPGTGIFGLFSRRKITYLTPGENDAVHGWRIGMFLILALIVIVGMFTTFTG